MNELKYAITNGDSIVALVFYHEVHGRSIVIQEKIDSSYPVSVYDIKLGKTITEEDIISFITSLLPVEG